LHRPDYHNNKYLDVDIIVDADYAIDLKYELLKVRGFGSQQFKTTGSIVFTNKKNRREIIRIIPCRDGAKAQIWRIMFNFETMDVVMEAISKMPKPKIHGSIYGALKACAKVNPDLFFDKIIHRIPKKAQDEFIFNMDEIVGITEQ
jgi:hypothetical protein